MAMLKEMIEIRDKKVVEEVLKGRKKGEIAKEFGLKQVSTILKKDKSREIIERETRKLLDIVPDITSQLKRDIGLSGKISKFLSNPEEGNSGLEAFTDNSEMLEFQKLAYKKQQDIMKAAGIFPSNSTNIFVQQIYNDNRNLVMSPEVFKVLGSLFNDKDDCEDGEIIDAEIIS
jgi:hypothetical protein